MDRQLRARLETRLGDRLTGPIRQRHDQTEIRIGTADLIEVMRELAHRVEETNKKLSEATAKLAA